MLRTYTPADLLTLANASCGTISVFLCLDFLAGESTASLWPSFLLPLGALAFDVADGYVARLTPQRKSMMGGDLDSLADVVSFGMAPAVLAYTLGARGIWDVLCLTYFVCCGISRLARFNATAAQLTDDGTGKVRYFEGTPIPTSVVLVGLLALLYGYGLTGPALWPGVVRVAGGAFHPLTLLFVASGSLMISTVRVPKP